MLGSTAPRRWWLMCQSMPKIASLLLLLKQCEQERPRLWMPWPQRPPQLPLSKASLIAFSRCLMSRDSKTFFRYPKRFFLGRNIPKLYVDHSGSPHVFSRKTFFRFSAKKRFLKCFQLNRQAQNTYYASIYYQF